jgi:serine/threonine protein kinase
MAPELWKGKAYSEKTDVWAIGITLFELIKLERPFAA